MFDSFSIHTHVTIRHARRDDLRKLEWFGLFSPFRDITERAYARAEQGEIAFLVAELNSFPVGQVWVDLVKLAGAGVGIIWALRVLQPLQNLGIGTRLIRAAEQTIRDHGLPAAEIGVSVQNQSAKRLYERLGYIIQRDNIERWSYTTPDGDTQQVEEHGWILRKRLEP